MKKLTASLVGVVMGGGILIEPVHANIASQAYVDGKIQATTTDLSAKQDISKLVGSDGYTNAINDDEKYPSVKAVHDAIEAETNARTSATEDLEQRITDHQNAIIDSNTFQSEQSFEEGQYPSAQAVKDAIENATSGLKTEIDIDSKQEKSNLVTSDGFSDAVTDDTKYPSVKAVNDEIAAAKSEVTNEISSQIDAVQQTADEASATATYAQNTANAAIPKPSGQCTNAQNKCVLTFDGSSGYAWEVIERGENEKQD